MHYDLKRSSNNTLLWAVDIVLMRKAQYIEFLDYLKSGEKLPNRHFIIEKIWYEDGVTLEDFDTEIESILYELDKDYRYE